MHKIGVALIAFSRPFYFKRVVESLEKQTQLHNTHFHIFSDGSRNKFSRMGQAPQSKIDEVRKIFDDSNLPYKHNHHRENNIGNAINQFEAVEYMSERYDYFLVVEDDIVLSKHYLQLARMLMPMINGDVFSINLNSRRLCEKEDIEENLDKLTHENTHWFAEIWSSEQWRRVRPEFLRYYEFVKDCDYRRRPHQRIKKFFHDNGHRITQTSQDAGKDFALKMSGMKRLTTVVNRGFYIGRKGMHFTPDKYRDYGFDDMKPYEFESDSQIKSFMVQ